MRATDMLADDQDERVVGGVSVRKGSVGAFLVNARILSDPAATLEERQMAERDIVELLPALRALGLFDIFEIKDEMLRALVNAH
jgi:hypothetical protein